jgi:predicted amidohydrolase YtcJ
MALLIRRAQVAGKMMDVRVAGGRISSVGPSISPRSGDELIEARGGALIPGLHDHHIHLRAWAAARESVFVGPSAVAGVSGLAAALRQAPAGSDGWIRAVGYHESVAGSLDRHMLDRLVPDRPVRLQHRSGILWVLNSPAMLLVGADADTSPGIERAADNQTTGRFWRMDGWLAERLARVASLHGPAGVGRERFQSALAALSEEAASRGVTGWTDATPGSDGEASELHEAAAAGAIRQRLHLMTGPGAQHSARGCTSPGPVKILLDDTALPSLEWLSQVVSNARLQRRSVAVHCVTSAQLALAVAAFESSAAGTTDGKEGPREGDRIEHGAIIPPDFLQLLAERRLTVVTQPNFVFERGDEYLAEVEPEELPHLWRLRSLLESRVPVAAGTDAPFGSADPWLAIRASMRRLSRSSRVVGGTETVDWRSAIRLWLGIATAPVVSRRVAPGQPADLVLLRQPLPAALDGDDPVEVGATLIGGEPVFSVA